MNKLIEELYFVFT